MRSAVLKAAVDIGARAVQFTSLGAIPVSGAAPTSAIAPTQYRTPSYARPFNILPARYCAGLA